MRLLELKEEYQSKEVIVKSLQTEIDKYGIMKTRAAKLLSNLAGEKQKWEVLVKLIRNKFKNLEGDCLLAAGQTIYLGVLDNHDLREEYVNKWYEWM